MVCCDRNKPGAPPQACLVPLDRCKDKLQSFCFYLTAACHLAETQYTVIHFYYVATNQHQTTVYKVGMFPQIVIMCSRTLEFMCHAKLWLIRSKNFQFPCTRVQSMSEHSQCVLILKKGLFSILKPTIHSEEEAAPLASHQSSLQIPLPWICCGVWISL